MYLENIHIKNFRNLSKSSLDFSTSCNIFFGENGAGKSSILEAVSYLTLGRSFRMHPHKRVIQYQKESAAIVARLNDHQLEHTLSVQIDQKEGRFLRINDEAVRSISTLTHLFPTLMITLFNHHLFMGGPSLRRNYLNWGVFYHHREYYDEWRRFIKSWRQRNIGLKRGASDEEIFCWDEEFVKSAEKLDSMREDYFENLKKLLLPMLKKFLNEEAFTLRYDRGWPKDALLELLLKSNLTQDRRLGFTKFGPHRMDLNLYIRERPAKEHLSQGQQKIAAYAFYLSQGELFSKERGETPLILIDDLPSELDGSRKERLVEVLSQLEAQVLITGVSELDLSPFRDIKGCQLFHVKQGDIV